MKFIHMADVHVGAKPDKGKMWEKEREKHNWQAFVEVITKAKEEQVQLLLIAGDLFHRQPLPQELKEMNYQFSRIPQTQVVLVAGEHDYLHDDFYYRTFVWGENVHFLKDEKINFIEFAGLNVRVYGLSYWHKEIKENLCSNIQVNEDEEDWCNILLMHGGDETHIPFKINDFKDSGFDYVALGHIHKPMQHIPDRVVMAGALQPIDCNDTGEHGYFSGEIKDHVCHVEFHPLYYCEYVPMNIKVTKGITENALREFVMGKIKQSPTHQIFKVTLTGCCDADVPVEEMGLEKLERVAQVVNRCQTDYDYEKLKMQYEQQVLGKYIQALEKMPQDEITKKALYYGVEALIAE